MLYFSRWKTISIWAVVLLGVLFAIPNILPEATRNALPDWLPKRPMTLGLDLQGGSHILLAVDQQDLMNERLQATRDDILKFMDGKIAKWWMPDDVAFVDGIPHTATGKILKTALREQFKAYSFPNAAA